MSPTTDDRPLPYGWIQQFDSGSNHVFYVDTKAEPPRSIWTHPYDDEQYLSEHPDVREKVRPDSKSPQDTKGAETPGLPPYQRYADTPMESSTTLASPIGSDTGNKGKEPEKDRKQKKKGIFGKMKDAAIGTKEEREAAKQRDREWAEARRQEKMAYMSQSAAQGYGSGGHYYQDYQAQPYYHGSSSGSPSYPGSGAHYGQQPPPHFVAQQTWGPGPSNGPHMSGQQYGPYSPQGQYPPQGPYANQQGPYQQGPYYGHGPQPNIVYLPPPKQSSGGGSMALPILGGLAGGLLVGSLL